MQHEPLSILMVATKPPYPPIDGGRLLMWHTIRELSAAGHSVTFICPNTDPLPASAADRELLGQFCRARIVHSRPRKLLTSLVLSRVSRYPVSVVRHTMKAVRNAVDRELSSERYDVIHVEQVQAMPNVPNPPDGPPVVLRCQNVESKLWEMLGGLGGRLGSAARWEVHRMRRYEAKALHRANMAVALTGFDRENLRDLSGLPERRIHLVTAPFPATLPPSDTVLAGDPAVVLMDGPWWPIREATDWFLSEVWPEVRRITPEAMAHCFGNRPLPERPGTVRHPAPEDSSTVFAANAVLAVPLRVASGLRMKILEAWARGVPVVATPEAARGLETEDGRNLLVARSPLEFSAAIQRLTASDGLRSRIIQAGRETLTRLHDPARVGTALTEVYLEAIGRSRASDAETGIECHDCSATASI